MQGKESQHEDAFVSQNLSPYWRSISWYVTKESTLHNSKSHIAAAQIRFTGDFCFSLQERGCYVFAFAGPAEVRELELGTDMASVNNLLGFLEKVPEAFFVTVSVKRIPT